MADPLALLNQLSKALDNRATEVAENRAWYNGKHPCPPPPPGTAAEVDNDARKAFQAMSQLSVMNFLSTVADVPSSALAIEGFRFGESPTSTDADAWTIWQRNHLDADSGLSNSAAFQTGQAYALVWADSNQLARIDVEDPSQCIVLYAPGSRRARVAGLKRWVDDTGRTLATLYLPNAIYKFQTRGRSSTSGLALPPGQDSWEPREVPGEVWPLTNPLGEVPLVELAVNTSLEPRRFGGGAPEFAKQVTDQRRINHTIMQMLVTMDHQSFRQRWVTGWDYPTLEDGTPDKAALQKASAARLWTFDDPSVKVGEFAQADFRPFIDAIGMWVKAIASSSGTPPYAFLLGDMINVAADSLARIEGIKTAKLRAHARQLGEGWEEVLRLALAVEGNPKAADTSSSVVWGEFEERTATEQIAVAQAMKALGAPDEVVFSTLPGIDQQEARRWVVQRNAAALLATPIPPEPPSAMP